MAVAFVDFVHLHGARLLLEAGGIWAPRVYVSLMEGVRNHIASICSTIGLFHPDSQSSELHKAKHYLFGFTIRFMKEHTFTDST